MKLKLFIITLIAISFAVTGLLGGCGGKKKNNADEPQDKTFNVLVLEGNNTNKMLYRTVDGTSFCTGYDDGDNIIWLAIDRDNGNGYTATDTLYVLSGVEGGNDQVIVCTDKYSTPINFTATSSKSNIAKLEQLSSAFWSTTSYDETGESTINITTADGRKTWFTVKVVNSVDDMPEFIPNPPA